MSNTTGKTCGPTKQLPPRRMFGVSFENEEEPESDIEETVSPNDSGEPEEADPGLDLSLWRSDYDRWLSEGNWTVAQIAARIVDRLQREASQDIPLEDTVPLEALGIGADLCRNVAELVHREIQFVTFGTTRA
jgi:hypothetical protein